MMSPDSYLAKYIDLYREHCGSTPTLNNQEAEVIRRLVEWARSNGPSCAAAITEAAQLAEDNGMPVLASRLRAICGATNCEGEKP